MGVGLEGRPGLGRDLTYLSDDSLSTGSLFSTFLLPLLVEFLGIFSMETLIPIVCYRIKKISGFDVFRQK